MAVREVSEVTGFPEMLDGRLKTINPRIAGGILGHALQAGTHAVALEEHEIPPIDMVVVNLYEFEKVAAKAGAPAGRADREHRYWRSDADPRGREELPGCRGGDVARTITRRSSTSCARTAERCSHATTLWRLALKAFATTAAYDRAISARLAANGSRSAGTAAGYAGHPRPARDSIFAMARIRINPRRSIRIAKGGIAGAEQLHGKELSYNNLVDLDAAWQLILEFDRPAAAIIKHTNPCGCAEADSLVESYRKAFEADPVSAFGGVLAFNRALDEETAREIAKTFIEAIAAPGLFTDEALTALTAKKNLRLLKVAPASATELVVKSISGGYLAQTADVHRLDRSRAPGEDGARPDGRGMASARVRLESLRSTSSPTPSSMRAPDRPSASARAR